MPIPKPIALELNATERQALEKVVDRPSTSQQIAERGRIVLATSENKSNTEIAKTLGVHLHTVRLWRQRWVDLQAIPLSDLSVEERLQDLPRPGAPPHLTADQVCQMMALACEKPEALGRPISQWTSREIADELMQRQIVETISPRHAARLLKRSRDSTPPDSLLADAGTRSTVGRQSGRH
jgi:putative transposase